MRIMRADVLMFLLAVLLCGPRRRASSGRGTDSRLAALHSGRGRRHVVVRGPARRWRPLPTRCSGTRHWRPSTGTAHDPTPTSLALPMPVATSAAATVHLLLPERMTRSPSSLCPQGCRGCGHNGQRDMDAEELEMMGSPLDSTPPSRRDSI